MRFQCPLCNGIVAVENTDLGIQVQCGHCGQIVNVPDSRVAPGCVIADFIIQKELGRGGMGIVYLSHQISLDRSAALKVLAETYANDSQFVVSFIREARAAAKLNHPHIVQAYAVGEDEGIFYFAMEDVDGKTMKKVLEEHHYIPVDQALLIVQQVAEALNYAWHEQKLIHRDIKPDNIMLTSSGRAKLSDLGLARVAGDIDDSNSDEIMGTPQYISPEHLTGAPMDARSDIYSLGATFYHFVTGRFPYLGRTAAEIAQQHLNGQLTPPNQVNPAISPAVSAIIMKMMEKNPQNRYQDAEALIDDIRKVRHDNGLTSATIRLDLPPQPAFMIQQPPAPAENISPLRKTSTSVGGGIKFRLPSKKSDTQTNMGISQTAVMPQTASEVLTASQINMTASRTNMTASRTNMTASRMNMSASRTNMTASRTGAWTTTSGHHRVKRKKDNTTSIIIIIVVCVVIGAMIAGAVMLAKGKKAGNDSAKKQDIEGKETKVFEEMKGVCLVAQNNPGDPDKIIEATERFLSGNPKLEPQPGKEASKYLEMLSFYSNAEEELFTKFREAEIKKLDAMIERGKKNAEDERKRKKKEDEEKAREEKRRLDEEARAQREAERLRINRAQAKTDMAQWKADLLEQFGKRFTQNEGFSTAYRNASNDIKYLRKKIDRNYHNERDEEIRGYADTLNNWLTQVQEKFDGADKIFQMYFNGGDALSGNQLTVNNQICNLQSVADGTVTMKKLLDDRVIHFRLDQLSERDQQKLVERAAGKAGQDSLLWLFYLMDGKMKDMHRVLKDNASADADLPLLQGACEQSKKP